MKTPQVPAMPGMTPLGLSELCKCGHGLDACAHNPDCERKKNANATLEQWPRQEQWSDVTWRLLHKDAVRALPVTNPLSQDQAELARRKAAAPLLASKPQQAADFGLFGDTAAQTDLVDMSRRAKR